MTKFNTFYKKSEVENRPDFTDQNSNAVSLTEQSFKDESDANILVSRFQKTGDTSMFRDEAFATYGDFTGCYDMQTALQAIIDAEEAFASLPAKIRKEFDNDPLKLDEAITASVSDESVRKRLVDVGVLRKVETVKPQYISPSEPVSTPVVETNPVKTEVGTQTP